MVTWTLAGRESVLTGVGRSIGKHRARLVAFLALAMRFVLVALGLGLLSAAAWVLSDVAGLAAAGVSCLVLEWAVKRR